MGTTAVPPWAPARHCHALGLSTHFVSHSLTRRRRTVALPDAGILEYFCADMVWLALVVRRRLRNVGLLAGVDGVAGVLRVLCAVVLGDGVAAAGVAVDEVTTSESTSSGAHRPGGPWPPWQGPDR